MPTINIVRDDLFKALGRTYTEHEFEELCFQFGIELDEVTSERKIKEKETRAATVTSNNNNNNNEELSDDTIYKIEIPANRYDLLCVEGLVRALQVFNEVIQPPVFKIKNQQDGQFHVMTVKPETQRIRPFIVCAVLRGMTFNPTSYKSFVDLQDKLHQNICRKRTLVAIGTHDLDTLKGPFTYEALPPTEINFVPLKKTESFRADKLVEYYDQFESKNIGQYTHIIKNSDVYPIIYDSQRTVLSLPPLINGDHSKITLNTKNVLVECTATDLTKANVVLNMMVTMFSEYCSDKYCIEQVKIVYPDGSTQITPDLSVREFQCSTKYINSILGVNLTSDKVVKLLNRMQLDATAKDENTLSVKVPPTRSDIIHPCDIVEDAGIAYGFNNLIRTQPKTVTFGKPLPVNKLSDLLRIELALAGFIEVLTFSLCSHDENFTFLKKKDDGKTAVVLKNPQTKEFQECRASLMPGLLKTLKENNEIVKPIKLYEISDVVLLDDKKDVGARNERRLAAIYCNSSAELENIHGLLDRIMQMLRVPFDSKLEGAYKIVPSNHETYFPGRQADIFINNELVGTFGVLHPEVTLAFDIHHPCSFLEIEIERFV